MFYLAAVFLCPVTSPSMRREWIEIDGLPFCALTSIPSPSMRREWIEINVKQNNVQTWLSPSMRREWIEIVCVPK